MNTRTVIILLALLGAVATCPPFSHADDVTTKDVRRAIDAGVKYLLTRQYKKDGSWPYPDRTYAPGATALAVYALVHVGVDPDDPAIRRAMDYVACSPRRWTYNVSLSLIAMATVDPVKYRQQINTAATWLLTAQCKNGRWTYHQLPIDSGGAEGDNSNTQFAVLALRQAARVGVPVSRETWGKISRFYRRDQEADGGWGYRQGHRGSSYGSMTAAGICGLAISSTTYTKGKHRCGFERVDRDIEKGIQWLINNFSLTTNPRCDQYYYYYMYSIERVGVLTGRKFIGDHDWYREGAAELVNRQSADGHWGSGVPDTCFALLFLGKGGAPAVINKLKWSRDWNNDPHDAENLTKYYSHVTKVPVSWQAIDMASPLSEWMRAPILYITGHQSPNILRDDEVKRLRDFVDQGGFILAEACCGRTEFDKGFRALSKRLFPDSELLRLEASHPVYSMRYNLSGDPPELWGINTGCRMSVMYSPRDFSCDWEEEQWGNKSFKMGVNLISYATGDEPLRGKLDQIVVAQRGDAPKPPPRGALVIAQIEHGTDWNTDPLAMTKLMLHLQRNASFDIGSRRKRLVLTDPDLFDYPILYMTSHGNIVLSTEEKDRLRTYLERGGFLFSDACCGSATYDASFRQLVKELLPDHPLQPLPASHPIYSIGGKIERVRYKPQVLAEEPGKTAPHLEGVELDGRSAIVYNPYDMTCAIHGHACPKCRGIVAEDALRLATNIILYAMTF